MVSFVVIAILDACSGIVPAVDKFLALWLPNYLRVMVRVTIIIIGLLSLLGLRIPLLEKDVVYGLYRDVAIGFRFYIKVTENIIDKLPLESELKRILKKKIAQYNINFDNIYLLNPNEMLERMINDMIHEIEKRVSD